MTGMIKKLIENFDKKMVIKDHLEREIEELKTKADVLEGFIEAGKKARVIFQDIAQETQQNVEQHISNLVTLALKSVSPDFPKFVAEMVTRRNQLECDLFFEKYGVKSDPKFSSGGGPKDIASFALLVSYWAMDKNRATIILDEPFKNVSPDLQSNVSEMVKMISEKLGLQIIMVSHAADINECADRVFDIELIDEVSHVEVSNNAKS